LCAAIALHLAFAGFVLVQRQQPAAPEPGSGAKEFEVVMLPAWPEPGRRSAQLGSVVTPQPPQKPSPAAGPPMPLASASVVSEAAAAPVDPVRPRPVETSAAVTKVAAVTPAASAARTDMPPSTPSAAEAVWEGEVLAKLASRKRYPAGARHAGQQDTVMVHFVVDRTGRVLSSEIAESGGFAALDGEALALIQRASPFPPPPSGMAGEEIPLIVPVQFLLHKTP
jgi:protein TonB